MANIIELASNAEQLMKPMALGLFLGTIATYMVYKIVKLVVVTIVAKPIWKLVTYKHRKNKALDLENAKLYEALRGSTKHQIEEYFNTHCTQLETCDMLVYVSKRYFKKPTLYNKRLMEQLELLTTSHPLGVDIPKIPKQDGETIPE